MSFPEYLHGIIIDSECSSSLLICSAVSKYIEISLFVNKKSSQTAEPWRVVSTTFFAVNISMFFPELKEQDMMKNTEPKQRTFFIMGLLQPLSIEATEHLQPSFS